MTKNKKIQNESNPIKSQADLEKQLRESIAEVEKLTKDAGFLNRQVSWLTLTLVEVGKVLKMDPNGTMKDVIEWAKKRMEELAAIRATGPAVSAGLDDAVSILSNRIGELSGVIPDGGKATM